MKSYWARLPLASAVFIAATVGTGYILGRVTWELPPTANATASLIGPVAPYPFLLGAALGGLFGIVAGRELLRAR